ncbi:MAG TPA: cupin domain-containing protein [Xanthobacteraceae bacterium]|nr:cupin domain-containing protein [Xanthobacteraceae bacterium]
MTNHYFIRAADVPNYHPANHSGTVNKRLIDPERIGAGNIEIVHGTLQPGQGASPHAHPGIEQFCYLLEGSALAEVDDEREQLGPGDCCYFPPGRRHAFTAVGPIPCKVLVIYSPPYQEDPRRVIR